MALKPVRQLGWNELIPQSAHADWGAVVPATRLADQLAQRIAALIARGALSEGGRPAAGGERARRSLRRFAAGDPRAPVAAARHGDDRVAARFRQLRPDGCQ